MGRHTRQLAGELPMLKDAIGCEDEERLPSLKALTTQMMTLKATSSRLSQHSILIRHEMARNDLCRGAERLGCFVGDGQSRFRRPSMMTSEELHKSIVERHNCGLELTQRDCFLVSSRGRSECR